MKVPLIIRVCDHEQCVDVRDHGLTVQGTVVEIRAKEKLYEFMDNLSEAIFVADDELGQDE